MKFSQCKTEFEGGFRHEYGKFAEETQEFVNTNAQQPVQESTVSNFAAASLKQEKKKKHFYKTWCVIMFAVVVVLGGCGKNSKSEKIDWSQMELGSYLPEPSSNKGDILENTDESLNVFLAGVSKDEYSEYVKACVEKEYTVDAKKTETSYEAYNLDGYKLFLSMYSSSKEMHIELDAPMKFKTIDWPESTVGKLLPSPKSLMGKFSYERDTGFFVYIGETPEEDYNQYVKACSEAGFNVDYQKGDTYYYADNNDGYHLSIKYEGNSIMSVCIKSPDKASSEDSVETEPASSTYEENNIIDTSLSDDASSEDSVETEYVPSTDEKQEEAKEDQANLVNGMRADFKDAMDSYEKFMDEYVDIMKKYSSNPNDVSLLADYMDYLGEYADMCSKFEKWESEAMNDAETKYYIEVQTRVNKKLLEVAN